MKAPHLPLAQEGYPFIFFAAFCTLILALLQAVVPSLLLLLLTGFICWFFRDPVRTLPSTPQAVVSPADGKVILIKRLQDDLFLHDQAIKVSIFMNVFNVHVNRIPFGGEVLDIIFRPGRFYSADSERGALHNEYCAVIVKTNGGKRYAMVQVAGLIARRIVCRLEKKDQVRPGERFGLIRFGSRVDLYLPPETEIKVTRGQKVRAGETMIGTLDDQQN